MSTWPFPEETNGEKKNSIYMTMVAPMNRFLLIATENRTAGLEPVVSSITWRYNSRNPMETPKNVETIPTVTQRCYPVLSILLHLRDSKFQPLQLFKFVVDLSHTQPSLSGIQSCTKISGTFFSGKQSHFRILQPSFSSLSSSSQALEFV